MRNFWDERYDTAEFVYGESPNTFFAKSLKEIKPGILVLPCEGEGRNAVYAASIGWNVKAFDLSEVGKQKAEQFALKKGVRIEHLFYFNYSKLFRFFRYRRRNTF